MLGQTLVPAFATCGLLPPLQWRAEQLLGQTRSAGRVSPHDHLVLQWRAEQLLGQTSPQGDRSSPPPKASMEGRAIARPNRRRRWRGYGRPSCFNGGPSNCSAKLDTSELTRSEVVALQWRAEQLLGQTPRFRCRTLPPPDRFNGGPSNCSAKQVPAGDAAKPTQRLQWRAEQLLGQTRHEHFSDCAGHAASMEGRAIARPNGSRCETPATA